MMSFSSIIICIVKVFQKINRVRFFQRRKQLIMFSLNPLKKVVLYSLRRISKSITFSERIFRCFELPNLNKYDKQLALLLLAESRHIIWTCRNLTKHENKHFNSTAVINTFLSKLKLRILAAKKNDYRFKNLTVFG